MLTSRGACYLREKKHSKTFFFIICDEKRLHNVLRISFCTINVYSVSHEIITTRLLLGCGTLKREGELGGERSIRGL